MSCGVVKLLFEASIQKAQNGPSTQLIEATRCVERSSHDKSQRAQITFQLSNANNRHISLSYKSPKKLVKNWRSWPPIAVMLLTAKDGHDRPLFDKVLWCLVSLLICVCRQCLIARKIAELFSSNRAMSQFYEACGIDDVSRGSGFVFFCCQLGCVCRNR